MALDGLRHPASDTRQSEPYLLVHNILLALSIVNSSVQVLSKVHVFDHHLYYTLYIQYSTIYDVPAARCHNSFHGM